MSEERLYERAQRNVKNRKHFLRHVFAWVIMSVFFILLNLSTSDYFWAIFPILGWGIGVAFHGIQVFSDEWENVEIEKEFERLRRKDSEKMDYDSNTSYTEQQKENMTPPSWREQDFV